MSIFRKTLSCAVLAALSTCALAGCGKQDAANETAATSSEAPSAAITETISESTTAPEQTSVPETVEAQPAETEPPSSEALSVDASTPYGQHGALHVENGKLTDENGNTVQLYGMSTHGIAWFPQYINYDSLRTLRDDWNTNCIRLAMYTAEYGGYCAGGDKEQLKQLVKDGVSYATELGMYVIVDWHILSDGNPNSHKKEAKAFFREMSREFKGYNNVIYEICNEPNNGTSWKEIKSYARSVISTIRKNDKKAVIVVGTPTWSQDVDQAAADPIKGDNIMYALHFYAATHKADLRNKMIAAINKGLPVFVTEYGICDASGNGAIDKEEANRWVQTMDEYGVSYIAWNLSNKQESSSIIKSSCSKVSGFKKSDLSDEGKWLYSMLRKKAGLTK